VTGPDSPFSPKPGPTLRIRLVRLAWAACDLMVAGILSFLLARLVVGETWPVVPLLDNVLDWLLLLAVPFTALAVWRREWRRVIPAGVLVIVFIALYGELFLPSWGAPTACPTEQPGCATALRVMQFNFYNDNIDVSRLIPLLRGSGADVIAIEEFSVRPTAAVKQQLSDVYPYQVQFGDGIPGIGLISKYPIISATIVKLDEKSFLSHLLVTLDVNGIPLRVIVAHPVPPTVAWPRGVPQYSIRNSDDIHALAKLASSGEPTLLIGDFNLVDQSDDYRALRAAGLHDAFREAGWGLGVTWPLRSYLPPLMRIDYVWTTPEFTATSTWVGGDAGSDHLPVLADLVWKH